MGIQSFKGHQDRHTSYSQLDRWAQLNVLADTIAKNEVTRVLNEGGRKGDKLPIPYNSCRIFLNGQHEGKEPICSYLNDTLIDLIQLGR